MTQKDWLPIQLILLLEIQRRRVLRKQGLIQHFQNNELPTTLIFPIHMKQVWMKFKKKKALLLFSTQEYNHEPTSTDSIKDREID